jgi:hypothetical protein
MQVVTGALAKGHQSTAPSPLMEAYAHFRLDRQAIPCSKATMLTSTRWARSCAGSRASILRSGDSRIWTSWWFASTAQRWRRGRACTGRR